MHNEQGRSWCRGTKGLAAKCQGRGYGECQGVYISKDESAQLETEQLSLVPGKPTLQSLRIPLPETQRNISKTLLKKMTNLLRDLGVPDQPIATRAALDYLDGCRQSSVALLSLQTVIARKEGLQAINAKKRADQLSQSVQGNRSPTGVAAAAAPAAAAMAFLALARERRGSGWVPAAMPYTGAPPTTSAIGAAPAATGIQHLDMFGHKYQEPSRLL